MAALGSGEYSFVWVVPEDSSAVLETATINGATSQLMFNASEEDSGVYTCQVQSGSDIGSNSITHN